MLYNKFENHSFKILLDLPGAEDLNKNLLLKQPPPVFCHISSPNINWQEITLAPTELCYFHCVQLQAKIFGYPWDYFNGQIWKHTNTHEYDYVYEKIDRE